MELETGFKPNRMNNLNNIKVGNYQQLLEEKAKRKRDKMRRQMIVGVDFLG